MKRKLFSALSFAATVAVLVGILKIMNWIPAAVDHGAMRKYPSIEAAKAALKINEIYVPSYFPESLVWPPSEVLAQGRPFEAVVMEFSKPGGGGPALVISQSGSAEFKPDRKPFLAEVSEKTTYDLKGREAVLEAGACADRSPCSLIHWDENGRQIRLAMKSRPPDLIKIAESMLP